MRYNADDVTKIATDFNQVLRVHNSPVKLLVTVHKLGKIVRIDVGMADWENNRVISTMNRMTIAEAVAYIQGAGHMAMKSYFEKGA